MQTEPTAHHSPIGLFQRVCYLVRLASDARVPAARGTRPPAPTLIGVVLNRRGQTEVTVDPSGVGVLLQGGRATLAYQPGSSGGGPGTRRRAWSAPTPTKSPGLAARLFLTDRAEAQRASSSPNGSAASTPPRRAGPPGRRCPRASPARPWGCIGPARSEASGGPQATQSLP